MKPVWQERTAGPVFGCRFRREERVRGWWEVEGRVRVWYNVEVRVFVSKVGDVRSD